MPRKLDGHENYRVVVYPARAVWIFTSDKSDGQITCEHIAADIKRHVDDVASVSVEWDERFSCEFCGSTWTEDSPDYNGGCCDEDVDAHEASA